MFRINRLWLFGVLAVVLSVPQLNAQTNTATVNGTVTDAGGAIVPGATVSITNTSTGIVTNSTSNSKGFYNFPQLQIGGPYTVDVNAAGFKKFESTGLMLNLNDNRSVDVKLEVGASSQTVEVTASSSAVETTDTELKDTISASEIEALPLFGRDATGLQKLQAGSVESSDRFGTYSANGSQSTSNSFMLDGIDLNDGPLQTEGLSINPDAIGQLTLITSTLNPEFSRNSGEVINETIKSGTNSFHGSAFEFYRDTFLNNGDYYSLPGQRPPFHQNLYGGTIGGPIKRDKLFAFVAYQGFRNKTGSTRERGSYCGRESGQLSGNYGFQWKCRSARGHSVFFIQPACHQAAEPIRASSDSWGVHWESSRLQLQHGEHRRGRSGYCAA
jgi:hypothetical protein